MQSGQGSSVVEPGRAPLSTARVCPLARICCNPITRELRNEESAVELGNSAACQNAETEREVSESESKM